ncbi:hypothetical protein K469DRAFT_14501 [Zopfia rhizophila CBS 207.26]|uniref:CFEM domain-containing protein n=1 Tax=Zopfia rhizophila CBS 207.26 TaxID=1314779 RepID=A0A6A6EXL1_9PEZI|nr:hypothetical protein K469DRAFT_14501 [Zopfia rhizophila CBS 207.26]
MKFSSVVAAFAFAFVSSVSAQTACDSVASAIPTCGQSCLLSAGSAIGCGTGDYSCQCASSSALQASAQNCVISACGVQTALSVQASASAVCACVATATPGGGASSGGGAAPTTAAPGSSAPAPSTLITATSEPVASEPAGTSSSQVPQSSSGPGSVKTGSTSGNSGGSTLITLPSHPPASSGGAGGCPAATVTVTVTVSAPESTGKSCKGLTGTECT